MKSKVRILVAIVVIVFAFSSFVSMSSANHYWGNYHWARTSNPFTVLLGDNVNSTWQASLEMANADWNASSVLNTTLVAGQSSGKCRPTAGRVEVCNGSYGRNGWLGLAQIWLNGEHITQGTAKMNDTYFSLPQYNTPAERNHVMCQEVGHTFGLGHQDESGASLGTCMDYADDSTNSQHPNAHDYALLEDIYAHLDSTNTSTASQGASGAFEHPGEWGRLVSDNPHSAVYERDFGNGQKMITFVYWAGEHKHEREHNH